LQAKRWTHCAECLDATALHPKKGLVQSPGSGRAGDRVRHARRPPREYSGVEVR
jgi:hypothetical protein